MSCGETVDVTTDARVLFDAVRHGKNHLVRFILEASDVDVVNSRDLHGKTPLMACCYTKEEAARDSTVKLLLRHGADVNSSDDFGRTVLSYACEKRCNDILRILIKEHNIDPDIADVNGNTPLIYTAMVGNDIACDILIRHFRRLGLNVDGSNGEGFTALLMAAKHGNTTCAQILAGQGKASLLHRDRKYGLSVGEWLEKKGFTLQDITPVRNDGKGRSRFITLANIAAVCTGPSKVANIQVPQKFSYRGSNVHIEDVEEPDGYLSDATTGTDATCPRYFIDHEHGLKQYKVYPLPSRPKLKHQETQTIDDEDTNSETETTKTEIKTEMPAAEFSQKTRVIGTKEQTSDNECISPDASPKSKHGLLKKRQSDKRLSLPNIDAKTYRRESFPDRKTSMEILPEKIIANIELGDGRRQSIQLYADTTQNQMYWSPYRGEGDDDECDNQQMLSLKFDRTHLSVSDSETSTTDDGPIF